MLVKTHKEKRVFVITLDAPPANCYSYAMMRALDEAILEARASSDSDVILITGAGDRFFCAGADVDMLRASTPLAKYNFCLHANETLLRLENTPKLVIAAINGHCVGGGLEVALACDLRIARKDAGKLGLPEVKLGVLPGTGGTARLTRLMGKGAAMELLVSGRLLSTEEAMRNGLLHQVIEANSSSEFLAAVVQYAEQFCAPTSAPTAIGYIKRAVQSGGEMAQAEHLALERELQQQLFVSQDAKEGIAAYLEKRPAQFHGA